jgi:spore maturation protein CgeB
MKILCVFGEHSYGHQARGKGYEYSNFVPALREIGDVVHFESFSRAAYSNFASLNCAFVDVVIREDPDVIFFVLMGYELWLETLMLVRDHTRAALVNWSTDDSWKYRQFSRHIAYIFDAYATTSEAAYCQAQRDGFKNFVLTQWAANKETLQLPLPASECRYAVSFVGSAYGNRSQWIQSLARAGINVDCFGHGWPNGSVAAEDIPRIIQRSQISLNFGDSGLVWQGMTPKRSRQIKARIFEVPGAGGFLLTEEAPGLERYYRPGSEIVTFDSTEDLVAKTRYFLAHPHERDRIAIAGHQRTRDAYTYDLRFRPLIATVMERRARRGGHGGKPEVGLIHTGFAAAAKRHELTTWLRLLRKVLITSACVAFGKKRGARVARRLVYELSWRMRGRSTYTASGLPGRLFYWES